jgi:hypothetical protein
MAVIGRNEVVQDFIPFILMEYIFILEVSTRVTALYTFHIDGIYFSYALKYEKCSRPTQFAVVYYKIPITVAARSKPRAVFPFSDTGVWVRNPLEAWMSAYIYSVFVLSCAGLENPEYGRRDPSL